MHPTSRSWCEEFDRVKEASARAEEIVPALDRWLWQNVAASDVFPRELPEEVSSLLSTLIGAIQTIRSAAGQGLDRYKESPAHRYLRGLMLSPEEYHLLAALGLPVSSAKNVGLSDMDDYDVFRMLCYEDDDGYCYINIDPTIEVFNTPGKARKLKLRFGKPPEELSVKALRPEQLSFFRSCLPEVFARFGTPLSGGKAPTERPPDE